MRQLQNWFVDTLKRAYLTVYSLIFIVKVTSMYENATKKKKEEKFHILEYIRTQLSNLLHNRFLESRHSNQVINLLELHRLLLSLLVIGLTSSCLAFIMEHVIFNYNNNKWKNRPKYPYLP